MNTRAASCRHKQKGERLLSGHSQWKGLTYLKPQGSWMSAKSRINACRSLCVLLTIRMDSCSTHPAIVCLIWLPEQVKDLDFYSACTGAPERLFLLLLLMQDTCHDQARCLQEHGQDSPCHLFQRFSRQVSWLTLRKQLRYLDL